MKLISALLEKTEEIIRNKPLGIPFCKVMLCVYENNIVHSSILVSVQYLNRYVILAHENSQSEGLKSCKTRICQANPRVCSEQLPILLLFSEKEYQSFWHRTQIEVQKWTRIYEDSFVKNLGLETVLKEYCYLEEVQNEEENFKQKIWFYGEI